MEDGHKVPEVSFVIRLWLEKRDGAGPPEWRCQVRHVQTGEQIHCRHLADALDFVERQTGTPGMRLSIATSPDAEEVQP